MNPGHIVAMVACLLAIGFFSAAETAFSLMNRSRLMAQAEKGSRAAKRVCRLAEDEEKLFSTTLIGKSAAYVGLAVLVAVMLPRVWVGVGAAALFALTLAASLVFGEVTPRGIAKHLPEKIALASAPLLVLLGWVLWPLNLLFSLWRGLLGKMLRTKEDGKLSQEELLLLVEEVEQDGSIDTEEGDLLRNAIEFTELVAEDILTHRTKLEGVRREASKAEVSRLFYETKFSRLLVYEDTIDHIVGIIHQKDFYTEKGITEKGLEEIMTPPIFVHKTEKIRALLEELQRSKSHIAVVIDEYGGTLGIVTMEDILEELVGEIWDEHDEVVESFLQIGEDRYRVDCEVALDDFCDRFDIKVESDSVSVGGWVTEYLDKIPQEGDRFTYGNLALSVTEADPLRATFLEVQVLAPSEEDGE
ncbi:MAG: HlyC/CorC family transporter [Clostridia bacterium]|nr:HlyC/CorC family transporter [Clostridia bacterium]